MKNSFLPFVVLAVAVVAAAIAVAGVRALRPAGARDEGIVTLAQVRTAPGRPPLLLRTYAVSNGLRRSIVFDRPDPWSSTVCFGTFCTNSLLPDGGWDGPWWTSFRERAAQRIRVPDPSGLPCCSTFPTKRRRGNGSG